MPGNIQVSVLDIVDFPSSTSSSSSSVSLKVSMGRREYQTWDKGEFTFPLLTLRDNLIITLLDAEGKQLSRTGIETMSIVQKGFWDDLFPLEGGGKLHMKLKLILSEEERKRIHQVRESAVKKKHAGSRLVPLSSYLKHEVADLQEQPAQIEAVSIGERPMLDGLLSNPVDCHSDLSAPINKEDTTLDKLERTTPDSSEACPSNAPLSLQHNVLYLTEAIQKNSEGEIENLATPDVPLRSVPKQETSYPQLRSSGCHSTENENPVSASLHKDESHGTNKETALEKTPSNLRNLISAFESNLVQEQRAQVYPSTIKSQSNKIDREDYHNNTFIREAKAEKTTEHIYGSGENLFSTGRPLELTPQQRPNYLRKKVDQSYQIILDSKTESRPLGGFPSLNTRHLELLDAKTRQAGKTDSDGKDKFKLKGKVENKNEKMMSPPGLPVPSATETASISGTMLERPVVIQQSSNPYIDQQKSAVGVILDKDRSTTCREDLEKLNVYGASNEKQKLEVYSRVKYCAFEGLNSWLFPDEARNFCATTGSKQMMDIMRNCLHGETHDREMSFYEKEIYSEHDMHGNMDIKVNKDEGTSHNLKKSKPKSSRNVKYSRGLATQAVKVAIIVAFGTLVLTTRQRKTR
ncbi:PREDICTED: uncharacterized protein LOC104600734 isoform X2 [Nelumbo nucifera]|uniref:Uncharacterized protein LOC104600734 isoform X2 n=1 Tax=Nelumbo nucifera TaxID=4432 RepID=A0A1U8AAB3_NELNU|nr:PREDICTED: uncharacterized protein LOC104600734 isoform X2 [Nelumbo nucifera]